MSNPVKAFEAALLARRASSHKEASVAEKRLRDVLRGVAWHQEYVRVRQDDLREVLDMPVK